MNQSLVEKIRSLETTKNDGRGVGCVKHVLTYLDRNDLESAQRVAEWDWDKIRNHPDIAKALNELFGTKWI